MQKIFQTIKEIVANPDLGSRVFKDEDTRFSLQLEWAGIIVNWVGIFANNSILILGGMVLFWYGLFKYVKNILRVRDEWKAEKEKEEKSSSNEDEESKET